MKHINFTSLLAALILIFSSTLAYSGVGITSLANLNKTEKHEFNPSKGESFPISFQIAKPGKVTVKVKTADDDLIFLYTSDNEIKKGAHTIYWDGKDNNGSIVPDEAYNVSMKVDFSDGSSLTDNPLNYSGGEIIKSIDWKHSKKGDISFSLDQSARVLIRAGIKNGPMMKSMARWVPKAPGKVVQRWDGYDQDKVDLISGRKDLWILVMAYKLPKHSIITKGNKTVDYREYRKINKLPKMKIDISKIQLRREGVRLEKEFFYPRNFEPEIKAQFLDKLKMSRHNIPQIDKPAFIEVSIPMQDRWIMESAMYEIVYYLDYEFQSEEEQGFIPFVWKIDPSKFKPGRHIATIQLTGYSGFVVSKTVEFFTQ